jgi:hypothetical protein
LSSDSEKLLGLRASSLSMSVFKLGVDKSETVITERSKKNHGPIKRIVVVISICSGPTP